MQGDRAEDNALIVNLERMVAEETRLGDDWEIPGWREVKNILAERRNA